MSLIPDRPKRRGDIKVKDVLVVNPRIDTGNCILTLEMEGKPGDSSEKLFESVNGKGYAVFVLDERKSIKLFKMLTGLMANKEMQKMTRLVEPIG